MPSPSRVYRRGMVSLGPVESRKIWRSLVLLTWWLHSAALALELYAGNIDTISHHGSLRPQWIGFTSQRVDATHSSHRSQDGRHGRRHRNTNFGAFLAPSTSGRPTGGARLSAGGLFNFDPEIVKKRRRKPHGKQRDKIKEKWESQHEMMHEMSNLTSDKPKPEDLRAISLQEFITKIERRPPRRRIPPPAEAHDSSYDAIMYLKGLPYEVKEEDVCNWLSEYKVVTIVLIKDENGCFTGDAYVRCSSIAERDRMHREMSNKSLGTRYIQMYRLTESAYIEYYNTGFRREPAKRNFISPNVLVMKHSSKITPLNVATLKTGARVCGAVSQMYRNGLLLDCGVYEVLDGLKERVFCILMRNRIAKNVGILGQQKEWLRRKDIVLFPGIKLNLYVEKVRKTTAQSSFDEDLWREHFGEPFESLNVESDLPKRSMVYLTMDSSVSEDKVRWWEKRLVDSYAKFVLKEEDEQPIEKVEHEDMFQKVAVNVDWLGGRPEVEPSEVVAGRVTVVGNKKLAEATSTFVLEQEKIKGAGVVDSGGGTVVGVGDTGDDDEDRKPYHELIREFMRGSDVDKHGTRYHGFDDPDGYKDDEEADEHNHYFKKRKSSDGGGYIDDDDDLVDELVGDEESISYDPNVYDIPEKVVSAPSSSPSSSSSSSPIPLPVTKFGAMEDVRRRAIAEEFKAFPRTTLFDECIQLPVSGWLLRRSDVSNLSGPHVATILRQLGKTPVENTDRADFENRLLLCQVIKEQGLGTGLDPKTLIAKGLYKVKQSKKKLKRIIELTKNITGRKFTREDLDAATKDELQMLADESLKKFAEWDPPDPVKSAFVDMYGSLLGDERDAMSVKDQWEALKWHIVVKIYGEQSHLKEIVQDIEANDKLLGTRPGSSAEAIEKLVTSSIRGAPAKLSMGYGEEGGDIPPAQT